MIMRDCDNCKSKIDVNIQEHPFGRYCTFKWVGPRTGTALINIRWYKEYKDSLPWPVTIISHDFRKNSYEVARVDGLLKLSTVHHIAVSFLKEKTALIRSRIFLTAMVWGLAHVPDGVVPCWRHLFRRK